MIKALQEEIKRRDLTISSLIEEINKLNFIIKQINTKENMSRYNVVFTITKDKKTESKFEVIDEDLRYDKSIAFRLIKKKYPDYKISITRISPAITALAGTI